MLRARTDHLDASKGGILSLPVSKTPGASAAGTVQSPSIILGVGEGSGLPGPRQGNSPSPGSGSGSSRGVDDDLAGATSMLLGDREIGVELAVVRVNPPAESLLAGSASSPTPEGPTSESSTT